jgi:hypothetical protein
MMAAAAKGDLAGDPPAAIDPYRFAGRVERAGHGRYSGGIQLGHAFGRQPGRIGGDDLVHHQVPRRGGIDADNRFPYLNAVGRVELQTAIGFRGEHREQAGIVHCLIDRAGKLPIGFGSRGVFGDQRADALDRTEQITEGLICHDRSLPALCDIPESPSSGASHCILALNGAVLSRRDTTAVMIFRRSKIPLTERGGFEAALISC